MKSQFGERTLKNITPEVAKNIFLANFLDAITRNQHQLWLENIGVSIVLPRKTTIKEMYEIIYAEMNRSYRNEYFYKNELINQIYEQKKQKNPCGILLEKPIAHWKSRVDAIIISDTLTAYEIKSDFDTTARIKKQTDYSLQTFDEVYAVCSEKLLKSVEEEVDERVGIIIMEESNKLTEVRKAIPNAKNVNTSSVFQLLRREEYVQVLGKHQDLQNVPIKDEYWKHANKFEEFSGEEAHAILLKTFQKRFIRQENLEELPTCLAALYFKIPKREQKKILRAEILKRTIG